MGDLVEVAVTSTASQKSVTSSIIIWDYKTGNNLRTYKTSENVLPHCLSFITKEYLIATDVARPILRVWPTHNPNPLGAILQTVLPGFATAIAIDQRGRFCLCGIADKVYVWELASGRLYAYGEQHYQKITCIKFVNAGMDFLTAGEDGQVVLWSVQTLMSAKTKPKPRHVFSDHSMPVTDLYVGRGWPNDRHCHAVSVSLDGTLNFFRLARPALLFTVIFDSPLSSVTMNNTETLLLVGLANGEIQGLSLREPPRAAKFHLSERDAERKFLGHTDRVNSLCVSKDDSTLISGGNDHNIILWNIATRQMMRTINRQAPVTNVFFRPVYKNMFAKSPELLIKLKDFQRNIDGESPCIVPVWVTGSFKKPELRSQAISSGQERLREDIAILKRKNLALYRFSVDKLLQDPSSS